MKAVILAAGKGKRMGLLTRKIPKPMLPIVGRPLLYYHVKKLREFGLNPSDIFFVVGYKQRVIRDYFGDEFKYITQETQGGTGHALNCAHTFIDEPFIFIFGDTFYSSSLCFLSGLSESTISVYEVDDVFPFGKIFVEDGTVREIREKTEKGKGLIFPGIALFFPDIFEKLEYLEPSPRGEIELTDALIGLPYVKLTDYWSDIGYPARLVDTNIYQLRRMILHNFRSPYSQKI